MADLMQLTVGTRGSQMAQAQTKIIIDQLQAQNPGLNVMVKIITTKGDIDSSPIPLDTVGKDWFTKEIEQALLDKTIDFAVHSLKDLSPETPAGLSVMPMLVRDDPSDALITRSAKSLSELPRGAVVGTDSLRRKALLLQLRPDLAVKSLRGNANTRLSKLEAGAYDAIVLATAGLQRIDKAQVIAERFDPRSFIPAIGQGTLAVECRETNSQLLELFKKLQDQPTVSATEAEQAFSTTIGGGCQLPVGCYVFFEDTVAHIFGMVGSLDASQTVTKSLSGPAKKAVPLARQLALELSKEPLVKQYARAAAS